MPVTSIETAGLATAKDAALQPLAAGLQQLTELHISGVNARQLQNLPQKLQQLHLSVDMHHPQQLLLLASWVEQHASMLSSLELVGWELFNHEVLKAQWKAALDALGEAFAAAAADAGQAAEAAADAAYSKGLQLQSLTISSECSVAALPLLQHLAAHSLTNLVVRSGNDVAAQLPAVCSLTALRSLNLLGSAGPDLAFVGYVG
jgi:hypothetical protein